MKKKIKIVHVIIDAIRESGQMPSGLLYGMVMNHLSQLQYDFIIEVLKARGAIVVRGDLITWKGGDN